jgi:hypothetical protein
VADPEVLNQIIWFSVRGRTPMPLSARLPAFDAMGLGLSEAKEELAREEKSHDRDASEPAKTRRRHR